MAANPSIQLGTDGNWAIKEDNLLAYKEDGTRFFNKEFDFTRGSLATFVDKDGLIKISGVTDTELVTNGDFATDSDWILNGNVSISGGFANFTSGQDTYIIQTFLTVGKTYEISVDYNITSISDGYFGTNGTPISNVTLAGLTGSGTLKAYIVAGATSLIFRSSTFTGSIDNISVKEIQLDVPRIDFTDDATGHLLLEPQSTNLLPYSEDFSNAAWLKINATIISDSIISPDGTLNADELQVTSSGGNIYDNIGGSGDGVFSVFAKYKDVQYIRLRSTGSYAFFDIKNGVLGSTINTIDTKIEKYPNGWYKCSVIGNNANSLAQIFVSSDGANLGLGNVYLWGADFQNGSYPTSYIATSGSITTRAAETCNNSGSAQDFNSEEGVLYAEIAALANDGTFRQLTLSDSSTSDRVSIDFTSTDNQIRSFSSSGGGTVANMTGSVSNATQFNKVAVKYKLNDYALWINGVEVDTDTIGSVPTGLNNLNFDNGGGANDFYGKTKDLKVFKRAMSDGELYLLTVPQYQSYQEMATALNYTL